MGWEGLFRSGRARPPPAAATPGLVHRQASNRILEAKLLLLQLVEQSVVRVGSLLFPVDLRLESSMFGCEGLDVCLFHLCHSLSVR